MSEGESIVQPTHFQSPDIYFEELQKEEKSFQKLQKEAQDIFAKKGELCDSEGFYQHSGECWSDAIQQVMNNADSLKENVQKKYIQTEFKATDELPDELFKIRHDYSFFLPDEIDPTMNVEAKIPEWFEYGKDKQTVQKELRTRQKKWVILYLKEAQKRFLRHYILEGKRRDIKEETCKKQEPAFVAKIEIEKLSKDIAYRSQGKEGRLSAIFGMLKSRKPNTRYALEDYIAKSDSLAGGTDRDIETLVNVYNYVFFGKKMEYSYLTLAQFDSSLKFIADEKAFDEYINTICGIPFSIGTYKGEKRSGHEMAFYVCGGKEFFYEDNYGMLPFDWRMLFKKYFELVKEKANWVKISSEYSKLFKEKEEADKDIEKKAAFESLRGKYFDQIKQELIKINPETVLEILTLSCIQYTRGFFRTPLYPCILYKRNSTPTEVAITFVNGKLEEVQQGKPTTVKVDKDTTNIFDSTHSDEVILEFIDRTKNTQFENFFIIYTMGTNKEDIKNTGFQFDSSVRLERKTLLMDIIDKKENDVIKAIDSGNILYSNDLADAMYLAIHLNEQKIVNKLLEKKVYTPPTIEGFYPISLAIQENNPVIFELLLKNTENILKSDNHYSTRYKDYTLPYFAFSGDIANKSTRLTELLLENGFDINSEFQINYYPYKYTLLYLSYLFKSIEMMKFLCSKGATSMNIPKGLQTSTIKTLNDLAKSEGASQDILDVLKACEAPTGGRLKQTRKRKIEKHRRGSRKHRA